MLYDGTGCTIDTGNKDDIGIAVRASYVILRGFTIKNVREHGIRLFDAHHIVIEDCDISKWGSESEMGWGKNYQACVFSNNKDLRAVVIRHNECWSDEDHYFNDGMGAGYNGGYRGFPGADSDIFNNTIFQEDNNDTGGLGGDSRIIKHCTTRNNILHVREGERRSIAVSRSHVDNDFDHDLTSRLAHSKQPERNHPTSRMHATTAVRIQHIIGLTGSPAVSSSRLLAILVIDAALSRRYHGRHV